MAVYIIGDNKWYHDRNEDVQKESETIMIAAAKLVREYDRKNITKMYIQE